MAEGWGTFSQAQDRSGSNRLGRRAMGPSEAEAASSGAEGELLATAGCGQACRRVPVSNVSSRVSAQELTIDIEFLEELTRLRLRPTSHATMDDDHSG